MTNWVGLSKCLSDLCVNPRPNSELCHLIELLKGNPVRIVDLQWAPALWDFSTKVQFLREVFWCYDQKAHRISYLRSRPSLGLQSSINKLEVNKSRPEDNQIEDKNLYASMFFLRVYLVTHQDDTIKDYKGPEDLKDKRSVRRLVMKERPDYLVKLIKEIRQAKWIKESPLMRRHNEYMKEFYPEKPAKGHCKVIVVGYGD